MSAIQHMRVLFTGYAPVHFICFRPLYEQLIRTPGVEVFVSGGLRTKTSNHTSYDLAGMYAPLGVPPDRMMSVEEIRDRDFDVLFAANTTLIMPRNATTRVQLFHGISFRNKAIRSENMGCDYYFLAGPYMHRKFVQAGFLGQDDPRGLPIGFMKTDPLLNGVLRRERMLRQHGFSGRRPVLLFAPTGQKNNSLETMGQELIRRIQAADRYDLAIKLHDHPKGGVGNWQTRLAAMESAHCRVTGELDVVPLLHMADLLITDASSVSNEFSLLDRPMVFLDVPKLLDKAAGAEESMLDLDTWGRKCGMIVEKPQDAIASIDVSLAEPTMFSSVRQAMAKDLFYNPGRATDAALDWLRRHVKSPAGRTNVQPRRTSPIPKAIT